MVERKDVASWLAGPGGGHPADQQQAYAGERLGLPPEGRGSVAGLGARSLAYLVDSAACAVVAWGALREPAYTLVVFVVEVLVLTWLAGGSAGQLCCGLRVVRLDRRPLGLARAAVRTGLLTLLVPAVVWDRDGRGLHDRAVGSVVLHAR